MADIGQATADAAAHDGHIDARAAGAAASSSADSSSHLKRALDDEADDSEEQRPAKPSPPRHFHADPLDSSSKPPAHLHRDALQSIFAFLPRKEFALLTRISKEWRSTAVQMPSRQWSIECSTEADLHGLLVSPLRKHVCRLMYWVSGCLAQSMQLRIADRMAHLEELECRIRLIPGMEPPHWPARLTKLTLHLELATEVAEEVAALLSLVGQSLARHAPMVDEFVIRCDAKSGRELLISGELLSPLIQWPLKKIFFRGSLSSSAYPILRRMAHLTCLQLGWQLQRQFVDLMTAEGPVPPLEQIEASAYLVVTAEIVPLLVNLPTLRTLDLNFVLADPTSLVPVLRHLHTLEVERHSTCQLDLFVSALQQATQMTDLTLIDHAVNEAHLADLLPPMQHLQRLRMVSPGVRLLDFLTRAVHLPTTLMHLDLVNCQLDPTELRHLRPLRSLVKLRLGRCFTSPLDRYTVSTLTPDAAGFMKELWPNLRTFGWTK